MQFHWKGKNSAEVEKRKTKLTTVAREKHLAVPIASTSRSFAEHDRATAASRANETVAMAFNRTATRVATLLPRALAVTPRRCFASASGDAQDIALVSETLRIIALVRSFRERGHYVAKLGEKKG